MRNSCWAVLLLIPGVAAAGGVSFEAIDINRDAGTNPAVAMVDIEGDKDLDLVAMGNDAITWYENPQWTPHLLSPTLKNLNVCMAFADLDGDGLPELAAGADWQFENTTGGGSLHVLVRGDDVRQPWRSAHLLDEPSIHRIRWADLDGDAQPELYVAPLKGRGTTDPDFRETGVRLLRLTPPKDLLGAPWPVEVATQDYHVMHNLIPFRAQDGRDRMLTASFEGITLLERATDGSWKNRHLSDASPQPWPRSGASEIKVGQLAPGLPVIGTIEPWHGNVVSVYTPDSAAPLEDVTEWKRNVLDESFNQGHAIAWVDFDGDGRDELVAGHREPGSKSKTVGLYLYRFDAFTSGGEVTFNKLPIDEGGMATEDIAIGDVNGDGVPDIFAAGRATHNLKLYLGKRE